MDSLAQAFAIAKHVHLEVETLVLEKDLPELSGEVDMTKGDGGIID